MSGTLISPRDLQAGQKVARLNNEMEVVYVEVGLVTPIRTQRSNGRGVITAYRIFPTAWRTDAQPRISANPSLRHLRPFTVTVHNKVEVEA